MWLIVILIYVVLRLIWDDAKRDVAAAYSREQQEKREISNYTNKECRKTTFLIVYWKSSVYCIMSPG